MWICLLQSVAQPVMLRLLLLPVLCIFVFVDPCQCSAQTILTSDNITQPILTLSPSWHSLGPFRIGTREAVWGADPLEALGGFGSLEYSDDVHFRSPLTVNATVKWVAQELNVVNKDAEVSVYFNISYENVNWGFKEQVFGWSALQYQTWIRGTIDNHDSQNRLAWIYPEGFLEFELNGKHFFGGDWFSFNRAPVLVNLVPGPNILNVRLVRDVRARGGISPISIEGNLRVRLSDPAPEIDYDHIMLPDIVEDKLPSRYVGVPLRNSLQTWITVQLCDEGDLQHVQNAQNGIVRIAPGQIRPLGMEIKSDWHGQEELKGNLCYETEGARGLQTSQKMPFTLYLKHRTISDSSKFTFLHPSGTVSYALLKPPIIHKPQTRTPLLLVLHGAGVEADSDRSRNSLDGVPDLEAFALFPTGGSPWSGDDWHLWGMTDALSAVEAVHDWTENMQWNGTSITTDRIVVAGHSNGGQGTWYFSTHIPDRIIAAAALSGWSSVETYVPLTMWREADPQKSSILHLARSSYRHETLLGNLAQMPFFQQHGTEDTNVPPYHSRLMNTLRLELGMHTDYAEFPNKPHDWDGVMTTEPMKEFFSKHLNSVEVMETQPGNFSFVVPSCGEIGSKFGIVVDQLQSPDRLGRIDLEVMNSVGGKIWHLKTSNIRRMHFDFNSPHVATISQLTIDASAIALVTNETPQVQQSCVKEHRLTWKTSEDAWDDLKERYGRQRGALDAILRSHGSFEIVSCVDNFDLAVQVSRNMFQYYGADSVISSCDAYSKVLNRTGNVILLANGPKIQDSLLDEYPVEIRDGDVYLRTSEIEVEHIVDGQPGVGAAFLRPLHNEGLELVIWGWDASGLDYAARLIPTITGGGQPDFIVAGSKARYQGYEGALAMGFFDYNWNISKASYLP